MDIASLDEIVDRLRSHGSFLISAHVSPDPDAVGSAVGLAQSLLMSGKRAECYFADTLPKSMETLLGDVIIHRDAPSSRFDALVVLDTASKARVGKDVESLLNRGSCSYNIDHHISNELWAEFNYVDATAAASAQIVLQIINRAKLGIETSVANLLYAGILDDTGGFRYSNTSGDALRAAASLVELGADPQEISNRLYYSIAERVLKLRAHCVQGIRLYYDGRFAVLSLSQAELDESGCSKEDSEGLVDLARSIAGVEACAFLREAESNWKISLRSKSPQIDVNKVAATFGGGGHSAASGCKIVGTREQVEMAVVESVRSFF